MIQFISLSSGSNGNCYYLGNEETALLIDVGIGGRLKEIGKPITKLDHSPGELILESFGTVNEDGTVSAGKKCIRCTVCSEIAYSEDFEKLVVIDTASLFKALPDSSLTNDEDAILYFEINGEAGQTYEVSYVYDSLDAPVIFEAQSGTVYSIDLSLIPADAVIYLAVATQYTE